MNQGRPSTELDDILAICLDNLLRGEKTLAECLRDYPEYADQLKPALQVAFLTMRLKPAQMPAKSVDALEMRLRAQMGGAAPRPAVIPVNTVFGLSRLAAVVLIAFFLALGSGAGLVAASADDLPGDALYGVKRLWESIVLTFAPLTGQPGDLWLRIAETRLDEVNRLAEGGRLTDTALADLYHASYYVTFYGGDASRLIAYFNRAYLALFNRIQPSGEAVLYGEVVDAVNPINRVATDGSIIPLDNPLPPSLRGGSQLVATPLPTSTMTATNTPSPQPSATALPTDTASPVPTATDTPTPRIPPTPSRTPTLPPTRVPSQTPIPSVTATWTPLPLPNNQLPISPAATAVPPGIVPNSTTVVLPTLDLEATERVRATDQAVYITQTYEAQQNGTSNPE